MKRIIILGLFIYMIGFPIIAKSAAPTRQNTYVTGETITTTDVTENEDEIFTYLQTGVDTYSAGSVDVGAIGANAVGASELISTAVTAGSYTNTDLTVDADGRITAASTGAATGTPTNIIDSDSDTRVHTEESSDEDIVRIDIEGTETVVFGDGTNEELSLFTNAGTADGMKVVQDGVLAANQYGYWLYSNAAQVNSPLMFLEMDNAASDKPNLLLQQDGTGSHIRMTGDPTATPVDGDLWYTGSALNFYDGADTTDLLAGSEGVVDGWIQFDGTGTISITDSFNVSGIVDNGTGDYTITWDTDFANNDYAAVAMAATHHCHLSQVGGIQITTGDCNIQTRNSSHTLADSEYNVVIALGDQ